MNFADVSVIVPCFNCSNTIERAVASIALQSLRPREVILVDDCSNDGTWLLLEQIKSKYAPGWIKLCRLIENSGAAIARNTGWDMAGSKYVAFLDSDDAWHKDKILIQYQLMMSDEKISLSGHSSKVISQKKLLDFIAPYDLCGIARFDVSPISLLISNKFSTPTVMLLRNLKFRFPLGKRYAEDYHLWCDIALSNNRCVFIDANLAYLFKSRYGESGLSSNMLAMEYGVFDMYISMMKQKKLGFFLGLALIIFSFLKFVRRVLHAYWMRLTRFSKYAC